MSGTLIVAAAQSHSRWDDLEANVRHHCALARCAAEARAQLVVFPELSLSGYPDARPPTPICPADPRLAELGALATASGMAIVAGAPFQFSGGCAIAAFVFTPGGGVSVRYKTLLHPGEDRFFAPGPERSPLTVGVHRVSLAICAEAAHRSHFAAARAAGASLYAVSALQGPEAFAAVDARFRTWSRESALPILLANHAERSGLYDSAGQSALWTPGGLVCMAPSRGPAVVLASYVDNRWRAECQTCTD